MITQGQYTITDLFDGVGIASIIEEYYLSTSATTQTGGSWSTAAPAWVEGRYMWTRSKINYTDNTSTTTTPINVTGATGSSGLGISKVDVWYYLSTSATALSGGTWSTTAPAWVDGRFMWSKTVTTYTNATTTESTPANITGAKGATGNNAPIVKLDASSQVFKITESGAITPSTITLIGTPMNTTISAWTYSVDGGAYSATVPTGVSRNGNTVTVTGSTFVGNTLSVKASDGTISDTFTVAKVTDGAKGGAGADGYTILLTNESHVFAGSPTAALAGSTTSTVIAFKGASSLTPTSVTVGTLPTGMTASVSGATITLTVTTSMVSKNGTIPITIVVDGRTFTRHISYAIAFEGLKGTDGAPGKGITSIIEEYYLSTSATTQTGGTWVTTPPAWVDGRYMWTRSKITYTDSTTTTTNPVNVTGGTGGTGSSGVGVSSVDIWYYLSTSATSLSGGSWSTTAPTWIDGRFMWSKTVITYTNGTTNESTPANITGGKGATGSTGPAGQINLVNDPNNSGNANGWAGMTYTTLPFVDGRTIGVLLNQSTSSHMRSSDYFKIEAGKMYEFSLWLRRDNALTNYFGITVINSAGSNIGVYPITVSTGAKSSILNTNPYFWSGAQTANTWVRRVGYIIPAGVDLSDPELTKNLGENVSLIFQFPGDADRALLRVGNYSNTASSNQHIGLPLVKEIDVSILQANKARNEAKNAQTSADGKNVVFRQITQPSTLGRQDGDLWFDTDDGNKMYVWKGSWTATLLDFQALNVNKLSAISADLGNVTLGHMTGVTMNLAGGKFVVESDGDVLYKGDLVSAADATQGFRLTGLGEFYAFDAEIPGGRRLFHTGSTLPTMYDGDMAYGDLYRKGFGKIYTRTFSVTIPAATYTTASRISFNHYISDYTELAMTDVLTLQLACASKEWRCYETDSASRVYHASGDLQYINLSVSPNFGYTSGGTTVQVTMLIIGLR